LIIAIINQIDYVLFYSCDLNEGIAEKPAGPFSFTIAEMNGEQNGQ